jgi:hypothetical protein
MASLRLKQNSKILICSHTEQCISVVTLLGREGRQIGDGSIAGVFILVLVVK